MIKATQLRIGNLYDHSGRVKKVTPIVIEALFESERFWCKAIPLTEEWLDKLGYDLISENHYGILGHLIWKIEGRFYCDKNGMQLKYVHQLQNLYFALTNKELHYENTTI